MEPWGPGIALGRGSAACHAVRTLLDLVLGKLWALTFDFQRCLGNAAPVSTCGPGAIFLLTRSSCPQVQLFPAAFPFGLGDGSLQGDITVPRGHPGHTVGAR